MPQTAFVEIAEMRIHGVIVKVDVFIGIARRQPCLLHADRAVVNSRGKAPFLRLQHPVVAVVRDRADDFFVWDDGLGKLQILHEPILRCHRARRRSRIVLVIIHQHDAVGRSGNRGIVVFVAVRRHRDVQLHSAAVQVTRQFLQQRDVARLPGGRKRLEVDHQARGSGRRKETATPVHGKRLRAPASFRNPTMSPTQFAPSELFTMGKTSIPGSSAFRNGITRSSTGRTVLP